jgi:hypothetical protein
MVYGRRLTSELLPTCRELARSGEVHGNAPGSARKSPG